MNWLKTIGSELGRLFVDDGLLAVLALAWIAGVGLALRGPWIEGAQSGPAAIVFASGFLIILAESATRAARAARAKSAAARDDGPAA